MVGRGDLGTDAAAGRVDPAQLGLGTVFFRTSEAVVVGDADTGRIVLWNRAAEALFGYDGEEAVGMPILDLVPARLRAAHNAGIDRYGHTGPGRLLATGDRVELPALHRDGGELWVELSLTELTATDLPGRFVMAMARDVSERRRLQDELRVAHRHLDAAVDALEQGVVVLTSQIDVVVFNDAARRILDFEASELVARFNKGDWEAFREDGSVLPPDERPIGRALNEGQSTSGQLVRWRRRDGSDVLLRVSVVALTEGADITGVVIAFVDVTAERASERRRSQIIDDLRRDHAALEAAVAAQARSVAMAAHDLRNAASVIHGFAVLLDTAAEPDGVNGAVESIRRRARFVVELTSSILETHDIDVRGVEVHRREVDLDAAIREAIEAASLDVVVDVTVDGDPIAHVDPLRLHQMLTNLLTNAARHGRPPITVTARRDATTTTIEVRDHGDGIAPEHLADLFEQYPTAHRARPSTDRGSGLGLAIVHELAAAHGGSVTYEPAEPGGRFLLRLADSADPTTARPAPAPQAITTVAGHRVLVIDDDADCADLLRRQLAQAGLEVDTAETAAAGLAAATAANPDALIVDVGLPDLDGFELCDRLHRVPSLTDVPILLLTGSATTGDDAARALAAGAVDFLRKPVEPVELVARLRTALATSARTRDLSDRNDVLDATSRTDALTDILNRRGLDAELDRLASHGRRAGRQFSMLMIDLDRFKDINDTHGHTIGDQVLREAARTIATQLRSEDILGRWGGEEFLVLLPNATLTHATGVAERIREAVATTPMHPATGTLTASIGVSTVTDGDIHTGLTEADRRTYTAKLNGRNRVVAIDDDRTH